jgi:hypothetical protein
MRGFNRSLAVKLLLAGLLALAAAMPVSAQQEEPSSPQSSSQNSSQTPTADEQAAPKPAAQQEDVSVRPQDEEAPSLSFDRPPTNLATGKALTTTRSPFRWGSLSVLSADILQVFDSNYLFLKDNPVAVHAGALRALVVYAVKTGRSNFSLQYRPQVWASGEGTQVDYASHMVDFHTFRYITSQWAINVSDQFASVPDRGRLEQIGFSSDYSNSSTTQNPFLATGRRLLTNSVGISVDHSFTARDRMEFLVRHQYIHLSEPDGSTTVVDPAAVATDQQDIGGEIGWTHTWRRDNEFGVKYAYDREYFQDFASQAQLHSVLFGFSRRLRPSLLLRISGGPALMQPARPAGAIATPETRQTYQASAALFKRFGRSGLTLAYSRSNNFTGLISDNLNDRYDVTYSQHWNRHIDTTIGGAYVRQALTAQTLQGKSGWTEIDYRLSRSWSIYGTYSYLTQAGGPLLYGPRQLVTSGIRWSWDAENRGAGFGK